MNNREELSEKCNPEKKEKGQKSKRGYEINLAIELVLRVLRQGVSRSLCAAKFCGIFFHRVLPCGNVTFSVNAINNSTMLKSVSQTVSQLISQPVSGSVGQWASESVS